MDWLQEFIYVLSIILEAFILYLILKHKQYHLCKLFFFYIFFLWIPSIFFLIFWDTLYRSNMSGSYILLYLFAVNNHLHNLLKFGIIYEMYMKIYRPYPGARTIILPFLILTLPLLFYYLLTVQSFSGLGLVWNIAMELDSRIILVITLQFIVIAGGVFFFNLKIHRTLKLIILGFLVYQGPRSINLLLATFYAGKSNEFISHMHEFKIVSYIHQFWIIPVLLIWIWAYFPVKKPEKVLPGSQIALQKEVH